MNLLKNSSRVSKRHSKNKLISFAKIFEKSNKSFHSGSIMSQTAKTTLTIGGLIFICWNSFYMLTWMDIAENNDFWQDYAFQVIASLAVNILLGVSLIIYAIADDSRDSGLHDEIRNLKSEIRDLKYGENDIETTNSVENE
mgnify:CR=1 FL=1